MIGSKLFLDSNIWLSYFLGSYIPEIRELLELPENSLYTSVISIHEVYKKLGKVKSGKDPNQAVEFMENNSQIIGVNREIAMAAVQNCEKYKLHTVDSLIYTSAVEINIVFVTADSDFKNCPNTKILEVKE